MTKGNKYEKKERGREVKGIELKTRNNLSTRFGEDEKKDKWIRQLMKQKGASNKQKDIATPSIYQQYKVKSHFAINFIPQLGTTKCPKIVSFSLIYVLFWETEVKIFGEGKNSTL